MLIKEQDISREEGFEGNLGSFLRYIYWICLQKLKESSNVVFSNVDSFILNAFSETTPCTPRETPGKKLVDIILKHFHKYNIQPFEIKLVENIVTITDLTEGSVEKFSFYL